MATSYISAQHIGSAWDNSTKVVGGVDLKLAKIESGLEKQIDADQVLVKQMLRELNLERPDMVHIMRMLRASSGAERRRVAGSVKKLIELITRHAKAVEEKERLNETLKELALAAEIIVPGTVFGGTALRIGDQTMIIKDRVSKVRFSLVEEDDTIELRMAPI